MKKIITTFILIAVLLITALSSAFALPTAALSADDWILGPDAEFVTHGNNRYLPLDFPYSFTADLDLSWDCYEYLDYTDKKTEKNYEEAGVYITESVEHIAVEVEWYKNDEYESAWYIEQDYYEEFSLLKNGQAYSYITYNDYYTPVSISNEEYANWSKGEAMLLNARELDEYNYYYICETDSSQSFWHECGIVYQDFLTEELYLLKYDDYDRTYFYSGGVFATDHDGLVTLYKLEDEDLKTRLNECYNELFDDPLEDIFNLSTDSIVGKIASLVVFGALPLIIAVFSAIMLGVKRVRKYRRCFIALMSGSLAVLAACIAITLQIIQL